MEEENPALKVLITPSSRKMGSRRSKAKPSTLDDAVGTIRASFTDMQEWASNKLNAAPSPRHSSPRSKAPLSEIQPLDRIPFLSSPTRMNAQCALAGDSIFGAFRSCSALGSEALDMGDMDVACKRPLFHSDSVSLIDSCDEDEDETQMRRLASWATIGTNGTNSDLMSMEDAEGLVDDDGNPIDRKLLEMTISTREKRLGKSSRKRVVKFEYPPVSRLRECPRLDPDQVEQLFFTEEELDMYENDRESTLNADDIEIVANSSSTSTGNNIKQTPPAVQIPLTSPTEEFGQSPASQGSARSYNFGNYVPSPRKLGFKKSRSLAGPEEFKKSRSAMDVQEFRTGQFELAKLSRGASTPAALHQEKVPEIETKESASPRLIKSVQIFLRDRSSSKGTPRSQRESRDR
jgi:hypothetical protein